MPPVVANSIRTKTVEERFGFAAGKVDRSAPDKPTVVGVLLCGPESANKRRYNRAAFAGERVKRYDGRHVYLNHGKGNEPRSYQDRIGTVTNARHREDGMPVGDLAVNPKHPYAEAFLWDAEHKPTTLGMSHRAGLTYKIAPDGWEDVEEVVHVESVDVVTDPATGNGGIFESKGHSTMKKLSEWLPEFVKRADSTTADILKVKTVLEMEGMADAEAPEGGGVPEAIKSACGAIIEEMMASPEATKAGLKKLRKVLGIHHSMADDDEAEGDEGKEKPEPKAKAEESRRIDPWLLMDECKKEGYSATPMELKALAVMESVADRKAFITEQRAKVPAASPKSAERNPSGAVGKPQPAAATTEQRAFPAWN